MAEFQGKIVFNDIGPGGYQLETKKGKKYDLHGEVPHNLVGKKVIVKGKKGGSFGFMMSGTAIEIETITTQSK